MTLCSTCQGVLSQANLKVKKDKEYLDEINTLIKDEGYEYKGTKLRKVKFRTNVINSMERCKIF